MKPGLVILVLLVTCAGCATGPCDPSKDRNIFQVAGCEANGGYQQRLDAKQQEWSDAEMDKVTADKASADAHAKQYRAATAKARLQSDLAEQRLRAVRLQSDIDAVRQNTNLNQRKLAQLDAKMAQLKTDQAELQRQADSGADVSAQLGASRQRQRELQQQWDTLRQTAPSE